jgi:Ca-activated chloride channel family protein
MPQEFELSRRKALAALGTIGAASAGAGLGTSAFFGDQETFENNQLTAGELDLKVDWQQTYNGNPVNAFPDKNGDGVQEPIKTRQELADEAGLPIDSPSVETMFRNQFADIPDDWARPLIELEDVKPGDSGQITFSFHLFDNPGYLWLLGSKRRDTDNGQTEPEADDPNEPSDPDASGELDEVVEVTVWYDADGDGRSTVNAAGMEFELL